jgi:hypothetical protein
MVSSASIPIGKDSSGDSVAAVAFGEPKTFTPSELVDKAAGWAGTPVYLIGRVAHVRDVEDAFGLGQEIELAVENNEEAVIGAPSGTDFRLGDVVYDLGKIAAIGEARTSAGKIVSAVYFLAVDEADRADYDEGDVHSLPVRGGIANAIRRLNERER